jgi:hypothetical protein
MSLQRHKTENIRNKEAEIIGRYLLLLTRGKQNANNCSERGEWHFQIVKKLTPNSPFIACEKRPSLNENKP